MFLGFKHRTIAPHVRAIVLVSAIGASFSAAPATLGALPPTEKPAPARHPDLANHLLSPGFLSTSGNQIVDSGGRPQRIACAGYNEPSPEIAADLAGMKKAGFNCARYPFDEAALNKTFPIMDTIVAEAARLGLKVIFDHHVDDSEALCGGQQENGLWFDLGEGTDNTDACAFAGVNKGTITREKFKADWVEVARHYAGNTTVIGLDLDNEPLVTGSHSTPITWGSGGPTDILKMFDEVGSAIEAANPGVLIIGECPVNYTGKLLDGSPEGTKGIMDCSAARSKPVVLDPPSSKFVYSIHDYPNVGPTNEGPSIEDRNAAWGFLEMENIAPVWIGEMGASLDKADFDTATVKQQEAWAQALVAYINGEAPGGPRFSGSQLPFGTDWWAWGDLTGQTPDGTLDGNRLRRPQRAIYSRLRFNNPVKAPEGLGAGDDLELDSAAPVTPGGSLLPKGWFHTQGSQIVDEQGHAVRIASVGLPGDGADCALRVLRSVNYQATMRGIVAYGFNTVRIAWSDLILTNEPRAGAINYDLNPDLKGLSAIQVTDKIVDYAGKIGLRIIFDHHTNDGGDHGWGGQQLNGLWFDKGPGTDGTDGGSNQGTITAEKFKENTLALVKRYLNNPAVIGYDLDNEPLSHGAHGVSLNWGQGGPTDIWKMYTDVGNAILALNPRLLIICEGPQSTENTGNGLAGIGPEGDLSAVGGIGGVPAKPVVLNIPNQVVYSVHEYDTHVYDYKDNEQPATLIAHMNKDWGYLYTRNIAPVWVGEMGSNLQKRQDTLWAQTLLDYMNGKLGRQGGPSFTADEQPVGASWWLWGNFPREQTDGTLESDWVTPRQDQLGITSQMMFRPSGPNVSKAGPSAVGHVDGVRPNR